MGPWRYGYVYKGKFRQVAVKILSENKCNGEEFINEVASISKPSHDNVVTLSGFCYNRNIIALIYEFTPTGPLDKFIYRKASSQDTTIACHLEWKNIVRNCSGNCASFRISAGWNTRIVHFGTNPHNILLDKDFCPKISDFGLVKLCEWKQSSLPMFDARETVGYIASEVFCQNNGGISHKSDVYSYGMMLLEIVGLRRKIRIDSEQNSDIYFPQWIYEHLELGKDLEIQGVIDEEEEETSLKMILVGL